MANRIIIHSLVLILRNVGIFTKYKVPATTQKSPSAPRVAITSTQAAIGDYGRPQNQSFHFSDLSLSYVVANIAIDNATVITI